MTPGTWHTLADDRREATKAQNTRDVDGDERKREILITSYVPPVSTNPNNSHGALFHPYRKKQYGSLSKFSQLFMHPCLFFPAPFSLSSTGVRNTSFFPISPGALSEILHKLPKIKTKKRNGTNRNK